MNPLDQLADIRVPEDVSAWPPAIGYWITLTMLILIMVLMGIYLAKRKRRLHAKRQSLRALEGVDVNSHFALQQIHHVLKTAAQGYFPERNILQMQSGQWITLLSTLYRSKNSQEVCEPLAELAKWQYDQRLHIAQAAQLKSAAQAWIEHSLPPKKGGLDV